jgi:DNA polymerase-3 subunit gamma/tau
MSLYRKYRPQTFEDVVGQEHIAQTLRNAVAAGRTSHAYLFCGPRGTGKTTSARLLAKCLNCAEGPTSTPCNECDFCTRVRDNQAVMDLVEIDAASNTGVDNVRENIIEKVNVAPAQGRFRVYIIDEVHMLSASSFNALLKTLEEPPAHAVFVLATTDAHKVPTTITSRCQRFDFRRVGPGDIVKRLQYVAGCEGMELSPEAARLIALTADGALRDALTLLEQVAAFSPETIGEADVRLVLGTVSVELMHAIMEAVATRDAAGVLRQIEAATEEGASFSQLARDLINYTRDLLLLTIGFESSHLLTDSEKKLRHRYADQVGRARLMQLVDALRNAEKEMRQSTDHRLLLELTLVRASTAPELLATPVAQMPQVPVSQGPMIAPQRSTPREAPPVKPAVTPPIEEPAPTGTSTEPLEETFGEIAVTKPVVQPVPIEPLEKSEEYLEEPSVTEMVDLPVSSIEHQVSSSEPPLTAQPEWSPTPAKKGRRIHDLSEFIELWPAVLVRFKKKIGITSVAYLHDALPVALDDNDAVLEFKKEFHYAKACDAAKRLPFEQVLNECMAKPRRLVFRLAEPKPAAPVVEEAEPIVEDDDFDADVSQTTTDVHKYAQTVFAAEVVGRSGEG